MLASLGYLLRERADRARQAAAEKRKLRAADKQRRLEERLRREKEGNAKEAAAGEDGSTDGGVGAGAADAADKEEET